MLGSMCLRLWNQQVRRGGPVSRNPGEHGAFSMTASISIVFLILSALIIGVLVDYFSLVFVQNEILEDGFKYSGIIYTWRSCSRAIPAVCASSHVSLCLYLSFLLQCDSCVLFFFSSI
jgi:hypothetical protein